MGMGVGGGGGVTWESSISMRTLPYAKQMAGRHLLYSAGGSASCSVVT